MRKLILIKHAKPQVDEKVPSHEWRLSEQGRASCAGLAKIVAAYEPRIIVTSEEPKAIETGAILAEAMGKPVRTAPGLEEHDRSNVPMMDSREFISTMALFFKDRHKLVLGLETADETLDRFEAAVGEVLSEEPAGNVAIVTHGTVLALFGESHGAGNGFQLWRRLGLPSVIALEVPGFEVIDIVERVG
ncbi:MAG TPA: histidine phosphatase family protein [Tepidisphaeraceae bacterium]|jgi:broad specificity phosphatase PhoE